MGKVALGLSLAMAVGTSAGRAQPHADGGPWAPVLIDMASVDVTPREVAPGGSVRIRFRCHEEQAQKITTLRLVTIPETLELEVTASLDRETGVFTFDTPGEFLKFEGDYELRLPVDFRWDNGKTYHRGPPFGNVRVDRMAGRDARPQAVTAALDRARDAVARLRKLDAAEQWEGTLAAAVVELDRHLTQAETLARAGDHAMALRVLGPVLAATNSTESGLRQLCYRAGVRRVVARTPESQRPLLTIMPGSVRTFTDDDMRRIRRLGCDTVVHTSPATIKQLKEAGFRTVVARAPARFSETWAERHPEDRQQRYLLTHAVEATPAEALIEPLADYSPEEYELNTANPGRTWRVYNVSTGETLRQESWTFDRDGGRIRVHKPIAGHLYRAAILVYCGKLEFFHSFAEPEVPGCMAMILRKADGYFAQMPGLDVYRPTSLFYPFPKLTRRVRNHPTLQRASWHFFYSYQWGAGPANQAAFETRTGIPFDPTWLVDGGRYGDVNYPPRPEYLEWMRFRQEAVERLTKQLVDLAHARGIRTRVFWGDHWLGMEPHLDFYEATGMDEIVKACNSDVIVRMLTDTPGPTRKIMRFSPWFSWAELFRHANPAARLETVWLKIRKGALFNMPDGLTWGGETLRIGLRDQRLADKMQDITDEFRAMHALTGQHDVFRHDLNLYVVNAWGGVRAWCNWLQVNESVQILTHLTDLPVNVRFLALREIAENGVPDDAHVLLNFGEPGSAYSGGFHWADDRIVAAMTGFVERGGGLIGVGAPSHYRTAGQVWRLAPLLGVDFAGPAEPDAGPDSYSRFDTIFLEKGPHSARRENKVRTDTAHWICEGAPNALPAVLTQVRPRLVDAAAAVLFKSEQTAGDFPAVMARNAGQGRTAYISGYSVGPAYGRILQRAVFWAAGKEALWTRLEADSPDVSVYAYPAARLLVAANNTRAPRQCTVRADFQALGFDVRPNTELALRDAVTGAVVARGAPGTLATGFNCEVTGRVVRFLHVTAAAQRH